MATLKNITLLLVGLVVGAFLAFFLCHTLDFNPFNDENDSHVLEFSAATSYTPRIISIQPPSVAIDQIAGKPISDSEKVYVQGLVRKNPGTASIHADPFGMFRNPDLKTIPSISINPADKFFKTEFDIERPLVTNVVLPDTHFTHTQMVKYSFLWYTDPVGRFSYGFKFEPSTIEAIVVDRHTTTTIERHPFFQAGPYLRSPDLLADKPNWQVGISGTLTFADLWIKPAVEIAPVDLFNPKEYKLPASLGIHLINLER